MQQPESRLGSLCVGRGARASARSNRRPAQAAAPAAGANLAQGTETGIATFQQHCMGCHGNPNVQRAPSPDTIRQMSPERIYEALTTGVMKPQGDCLTDDQKKMLATFLSGRPLGSLNRKATRRTCPTTARRILRSPIHPPGPNGTAGARILANTRFQTAEGAGLTASEVPELKLKWAFGYPTGLSAFGQPSIVSGRVFVGTDIGYVYSLDAETGLRLLVVSDQRLGAHGGHGRAE